MERESPQKWEAQLDKTISRVIAVIDPDTLTAEQRATRRKRFKHTPSMRDTAFFEKATRQIMEAEGARVRYCAT